MAAARKKAEEGSLDLKNPTIPPPPLMPSNVAPEVEQGVEEVATETTEETIAGYLVDYRKKVTDGKSQREIDLMAQGFEDAMRFLIST